MSVLEGDPHWDVRAGVWPPADTAVSSATLSAAAYAAASAADADNDRIYRLTLQRDSYVAHGTAAPAADTAVAIVRQGVRFGRLAAGEQIWIKRYGSADGYGSVEYWAQ